jgi:serine/threonine protein kinase HipA of HipAB toxin-antitoxin module
VGARDSAPSSDSWERYVAQLREAYALAKGEIAARQRGRRLRLFDERGVHPFSAAWGRASVLRCEPPAEWRIQTPDAGWKDLLVLAVGQDGDVSSLDILRAAREDALREFVHEAKEGRFDEDTGEAADHPVLR